MEDIPLGKKVKSLRAYPESGIKKGDIGIITAYLPDEKIFAIFFGEKKWLRFDDDEKYFLSNIEVIE